MYMPNGVSLDAYSNGVGNIFPPICMPNTQEQVRDLEPIFASCSPDVQPWLLYAEGAIEFK